MNMNVNKLIDKLHKTSDPKEIIKIADEILEIIPFEFGSLFSKAFAQIELGLIDEAINTFDTALYYEPNVDIDLAYNGKGVCYAKKNEFKKALKCFNEAYLYNQNEPTILLNIASMHQNLGENGEAIAIFEELKNDDKYGIFAKFQIEIIKNGGELEFESIDEGLMKARVYSDLDKPKKAVKIYKQILNIQEDCIPAYNHLGLVYEDLNMVDEALNCYKTAISYQPKAFMAWNYLANLYLRIGDYAKANETYEDAFELMPYDEVTLTNNAVALMHIGKYLESIEMCKRALEINPSLVEAYNTMAWSYEQLDDFEKAFECYNKGIEINPNHGALYNNKAWALRKVYKHSEALELYNQAIEVDGVNPIYLKNIAATYKEMDNINKAREYYDKAFELDQSIESFDDLK